MNLRKIRISKRLGLAFGLVLVLVLGMAVAATLMLRDIERLAENEARMATQLNLVESWESLTELNLDRTTALVKAGESAALREHLSPLMKGTTAQISTLRERIEGLALDDDGKDRLKAIDARRKDYIAARDGLFARIKGGEAEAVRQDSDRVLAPAVKAYAGSLQSMRQHLAQGLEVQRQAQAGAASQARRLLWVLALLAVVAGAGLSWFITRSVLVPVGQAIAASRRVAQGDLSQPLPVQGQDELTELAAAINAMNAQLSGSLGGVLEASGMIQTASTEIASGSTDLSNRTEQAASSLQQTASSLEELTGTVGNSAASAREAATLATGAAGVAERGGAVVQQVVATMEAINEASRRIADIIGTIDGIAFQTNILALNAAVEAARAGEQGRGFAVVASEVRSLAQRSAQAAREIKGLIGTSVERVEAGTVQVAAAGQTMREIVDSVQRVKDIIAEISTATGEQSSGIGAVNTAVTDLDRVTQQNAALVEQSAAAAESLKDQATRLTELVAGFKLNRA